MLTKTILQADEKLKGLTDDQLAQIELLSKNDESAVLDVKIGEKTKELLDKIDGIIDGVMGEKKPANTKTFDYVESALKGLKSKSGDKDLQKQIDDLKREKSDLEKKIKDGDLDGVLKTKVEKLETAIRDKDDELNTLRATKKTETEELTRQLNEEKARVFQLDTQTGIDAHLVGEQVKFNDTIPETALKELLKGRRESLLATIIRDVVDDGNGGKETVYRDKTSKQILRNPNNGLKPYTIGELYMTKITDLVAAGKKQPGGGSTPPGGGGGGNGTLDISSARTQIEADQMIRAHVIKEGLAVTDNRHAERAMELRTEHKVGDLPIRIVEDPA